MNRALVLLVFLLPIAPGPAGAEPIRIMPLGDSITESATGHASYRYWLWHDLLDAGFDVDLVGTRMGVSGGPPLFEDFDQDHEGHWGLWVDLVLGELAGWASTTQPDLVLVHLGTNDLFYFQSVASTLSELGQVVDVLRSVNPNVGVLLAQLIPSTSPRLDDIPLLNAGIPDLALEKTLPESPVIVVDQFTGFDPILDTWDGLHPDESGELKMAARWLESLVPLLSGPTEVQPLERHERGIRLDPPFPNPFRTGTSVTFAVPRRQRVRLTVHDGRGVLVATLLDTVSPAGRHRAAWNGRDDRGARLPAGVYLLRLATDAATRGSKVVLVR